MAEPSSLISPTLVAVILMFMGTWFLTVASKMMRSKDLAQYRKAMRVNVFAIGVYWVTWVGSILWPGLTVVLSQNAATISIAIGLLLIFRFVKDVSLTKKVVIWFVWSALNLAMVTIYARWFGT